jgi:diacylglycerol kinase (ATP)
VSAFGTPLLIANPGAGRAHSPILDRLVAALRARDVDPDVAVTAGAGDAGRLARDAVESGRRLVVAVGGDGTVHEIVNGIVDAATGTVRGDDPVLGVVGAGSGSDLVRTFGLDRSPETLAGHLVTDAVLPLDLGRVRLRGPDGAPRVRVFANIAEAGYGATVTHLANHLPRRLGRARYAAAIAASAPRFRRVLTRVTVDGGTTEEPLCNVVVANGQFFGGGLMVAPRALPSNGRLNVQSWGGRPIDVVLAQRELRRGRHLARDDVREWQSSTVEVVAAKRLRIEADGEVLGTTPATFDVLPRALRFKL